METTLAAKAAAKFDRTGKNSLSTVPKAELRELEELGFKVDLFAEGTSRTRGNTTRWL